MSIERDRARLLAERNALTTTIEHLREEKAELLAACEDALPFVVHTQKAIVPYTGYQQELIKTLQAAIAKARGNFVPRP